MFNKILIANRGEIAARIIKTCNRMGIRSVAVYSDADEGAPFTQAASEAIGIGPAEAAQSYLNSKLLIDVARQTGASAIHPGFGFLSENAEFATLCRNNDITFIGPTPEAITAMASKQTAKQILEHTGVPMVPGYHGTNASDEDLRAAAQKIGFPLLLKAAAGGGGKGMRLVHNPDELPAALIGARREAQQFFGSDVLIIEKYLPNPRHVEVQIIGDNFGNLVHLYTRDCSIQRRHQKIIEEAPAPLLLPELEAEITTAALAVARKIDYTNAGTVEFLLDIDNAFYFLEMNTRLQVEHPVTEMITGIDLVEWQILVAANNPLPLQQNEIKCTGHALECRIYAEDPLHEFLPSAGTISLLHEPHGANIRIDSGIALHSTISSWYDPMIAKLITFGSTREAAVDTMQHALTKYYIGGIKTNIPWLGAIIATRAFKNAELDTAFLTTRNIAPPICDRNKALLAAVATVFITARPASLLFQDTFNWQLHLPGLWREHFTIEDEDYIVQITPISAGTITLLINNSKTVTLDCVSHDNHLTLNDGTTQFQALVESAPGRYIVHTSEGSMQVSKYTPLATKATLENRLIAPMPATIIAILAEPGTTVACGDAIIILEAMKMEHTIRAPHDGIIQEILYPAGAQIAEGALLATMEAEAHENS